MENSLLFTAFLFGASPGIGAFAVMATTLRHGTRAGLLLSAGEVMGDMMYLAIALFSLGIIAEHLGPVMTVIRYGGAAYLVYLGVKQMLATPEPPTAKSAPPNPARQLATGFVIAGTNPKVIAFYLAFLPAFVDLSGVTLASGLRVMGIIATGVFCGVALYALFGGQMRRHMQRPRTVRIVNVITGLVLIAIAGALLFS
ncbi:LysE family translocator [Paracoccaceae bacterium GXU_MW_L88]